MATLLQPPRVHALRLTLLLAVAVAAACGDTPPAGEGLSRDTTEAAPSTPAPPDGPPVGSPPAQPGLPASSSPPAVPSTWAYTCPDGLRIPVHYRADEAVVTLPARELRLPPVPAASGVKYQAGDTLWWDKGGEALLEVGEERHTGCAGRPATSPEDAARLLGFDFRGLGQEPGWLVDVDLDRQLRWVGDYGVVRFAAPAPETVEETDSSRVWRAGTAEHRITVTVLDRPCRDAMSGQAFTHTVEVEVDGDTLDGCGRWLNGEGEPAEGGPGR